MAIWYAEQAARGKINVCKLVQLAARRFLKMLEAAQSGKADYYWSPDHVFDVCDFVEKMPQVEGFEGNFEIQPWQMFLAAGVFGFRRWGTGARLVRYVYVFIPRKNGKSSIVGVLSHYAMTCEGEVGPLGYIGAATKDQANKVFEPARKMAEASDEFKDAFGVKTTADKITYGCNGGMLQKLTKIGEHNDGHNPHLFVAEELHAQERSLYEVMRSSFGARKNPLLISISTAGRQASGLGYETWQMVERLLTGQMTMDSTFGLIFAPDMEDTYTENGQLNEKALMSERVIQACNPNYGVSIDADVVREFAEEAKQNYSKKLEFFRTRLNVWVKQAGNIIDPIQWAACKRPGLKMEDFKGERCWVGCDLASRNDLAVVSICFESGNDVAFFWWCYLCEDAPSFTDERTAAMYHEWSQNGHLIVHPGGMMDLAAIRRDVEAFCDEYDPEAIGVDDYQANQFTTELLGNGYPVRVFKKNAKSYTEPTDEFLARVTSGTMAHDGNPIAAWCAANVVGKRDVHGQILPKRDATQPHMKIDCIDAAITANAMRIAPPDEMKNSSNPYLKRGLLGDDGAEPIEY